MKPPPFTYLAPRSVDEAVALLAEHGDEARVLAGGQSLLALLNLRLARPSVLVDIRRCPELHDVRQDGAVIEVGAAVTQSQLGDHELAAALPLVAEALPHIAHREIRNAGTVCGSLAHGDPAAELPTVAVAAAAELVVRSARGTRTVPAARFYTGYLTTVLEPDELVTAVRFPVQRGVTATAFEEVAPRHGDFALAGAAAALGLDGTTITSARLVLLGVDATPVAVSAADQLVGASLDDDVVGEVAAAASAEIDPRDDVHASAGFRRHLARVLAARALARAGRIHPPHPAGLAA